jgi:hypothetical protein
MTFNQFYKTQIYLDMDGVICDFLGAFERLGLGSFRQVEKDKGKSFVWSIIKNRGVKFWSEEILWLPDGKELWNYVKKFSPIILTKPAKFEESREGKSIWVKRELGEDVPVIFSFDKSEYAKEDRILIDDQEDNIEAWKALGGVGILHINAQSTIKQLQELNK